MMEYEQELRTPERTWHSNDGLKRQGVIRFWIFTRVNPY